MPSEPERKILVLAPGDFAFGESGTVLQTLLGSCISITFWCPRMRVGAMCHYMLPTRPQNKPAQASGRYADDAIRAIAERFRNLGLAPTELEVRMFGGANMFPGLLGANPGVGERNIEAGRALLRELGFTLTQEDLAGVLHRRVVFEVGYGRVKVQYGEGPSKARRGSP